ncbi:MAG TPA: FHA domain-containing protein [Bdellovibrionales bacterium]|nr:FHA domain-containing protein [Bdellovibrionales bacterium]
MALYLVIVQGPRAGDRFKLKPGLSFGRSKADVNLRDPKVSNKHAQIAEVDGELVLVDQGSTNGIKVDGKKLPEVVLRPGLKMLLGTTEVEVTQELDADEDMSLEEWRRSVLRTMAKASGYVETNVPVLKAFHKPVGIEFEDAGVKHSRIFGYGPRRVDPFSLELDVDVPASPGIFFELIPEGDKSVRFRTPHPDFVRLNGVPVDADVLKDGDIINVQDVELKVSIK